MADSTKFIYILLGLGAILIVTNFGVLVCGIVHPDLFQLSSPNSQPTHGNASNDAKDALYEQLPLTDVRYEPTAPREVLRARPRAAVTATVRGSKTTTRVLVERSGNTKRDN